MSSLFDQRSLTELTILKPNAWSEEEHVIHFCEYDSRYKVNWITQEVRSEERTVYNPAKS